MGQSKRDMDLGRFLSLVLRHHPEAIGITLDSNGWAQVDALLDGMNQKKKQIDREDLERIVRENSKQRYSFNEDHTKIRANQGHSIEVDVELRETAPPPILYHGTADRFLESIKREGITRQTRQYVHLSGDVETALQVGKRHGRPVVLVIDVAQMVADGCRFFQSKNGVWLCSQVPFHYVKEVREKFSFCGSLTTSIPPTSPL